MAQKTSKFLKGLTPFAVTLEVEAVVSLEVEVVPVAGLVVSEVAVLED